MTQPETVTRINCCPICHHPGAVFNKSTGGWWCLECSHSFEEEEQEAYVLASDYDTLRAECERLRAELQESWAELQESKAAWKSMQEAEERHFAAARQAVASVQALRKALEKYGRHKATCASTRRVEEFRPAVDEMSGELTTRVVYVPANLPCDCGLVAVLAGGEAATQEGKP